MAVLFQFVLRLAFGLALSMAISPPSRITSGFFRNHLYVTLGLCVLAALVAFSSPEFFHYGLPLAGAVLSYIGSVIWLYEKRTAGRVALVLVAALALGGAIFGGPSPLSSAGAATILRLLDPLTGGLVLGTTIAAMFLGHWYLNTPTMQLGPLRRLLAAMLIAVALRAGLCGAGLALECSASSIPSAQWWFLALRWTSGIAIPLVLIWMTWKTLQIPNTQSATGILYVAVITTFTGELTSQLLSAHSTFPL